MFPLKITNIQLLKKKFLLQNYFIPKKKHKKTPHTIYLLLQPYIRPCRVPLYGLKNNIISDFTGHPAHTHTNTCLIMDPSPHTQIIELEDYNY